MKTKYILVKDGEYYHGVNYEDKILYVKDKDRACKFYGKEYADIKAKELDCEVVEL